MRMSRADCPALAFLISHGMEWLHVMNHSFIYIIKKASVMNSQKQENMLSLAMDSTRQEREKSGILSVGVEEEKKRWEVIVKYHGNLERIVSEEVQVELLIAGYAIVTLPEALLPALADLEEVEYMEKPKSLVYGLYEAKEKSCLTRVSVPVGDLSGKGVLLAVIDSGERVIIMSS